MLAIVIALVVTYQFVGPAVPKRIVFATGEDGGAYAAYGERFAAALGEYGIVVELRQTAGSVDNLQLLERGEADLGFVQGGIADDIATSNVMAIGTMYLEPLWLFVREGLDIEDVGGLAGLGVAAGMEGSGTRAVIEKVIAENGMDDDDLRLEAIPSRELVAAFAESRIDAAFVIAGPASEVIRALVYAPGVRLQNLHRAEAYARRSVHLSHVTFPAGVLDLAANLPPAEINTVALGAMLAANRDLHPALVDLLLVAARDIHGRHSLLADAGEFPTPKYADLPLSDDAERHFRHGPPLLMRYLPFWAATFVDRLWIMLLPLIGLAVPLVKLFPPAYRWRIRRRLLRMYGELDAIDPLHAPIAGDDDRTERLEHLDRLENDTRMQGVPREYTDDIYKLRRDIDLIRRRLRIDAGMGRPRTADGGTAE